MLFKKKITEAPLDLHLGGFLYSCSLKQNMTRFFLACVLFLLWTSGESLSHYYLSYFRKIRVNQKVEEPHDPALSNLFVKPDISLEFRVMKCPVSLRQVLASLWRTEEG